MARRDRDVRRVLLVEGACNALVLAAKLVVGVATSSTAVLGDAIHSLGDLANINFLSVEAYRGPDRGLEINLADLLACGIAIGITFRFKGREFRLTDVHGKVVPALLA